MGCDEFDLTKGLSTDNPSIQRNLYRLTEVNRTR